MTNNVQAKFNYRRRVSLACPFGNLVNACLHYFLFREQKKNYKVGTYLSDNFIHKMRINIRAFLTFLQKHWKQYIKALQCNCSYT